MSKAPKQLSMRLRMAVDNLLFAEGSGVDDPEARAQFDAALAEFEEQLETVRAETEPLCDAVFRARLLRQGLSTQEMAEYVDAVESMQQRLRDAIK